MNNTVAIAEGNNPTETLNNGLNLLGGLSKFISKEDAVLILIDLHCPFTCPSSINQETLDCLLNNIKIIGVSKIQILPGVMWGIDQKKALKSLGLEDLIQNYGATSITYEELYKFSAPVIEEVTKIICLSQIRTDPLWKLTCSSFMLWNIKSPKKRWNDILNYNAIFGEERVQHVFEFLERKIPTLYINDSYYLLTGNGPIAWNTTKCVKTNNIIISNNIMAVDWITYEHFGLDPALNLFLRKASELNLIDRNSINLISQMQMDNPLIKFSEIEPTNINIEGLTVYTGDLNSSERYALLQFLFMIKNLFLKDASNFGNWAILAGTNPPDPEINCDIIVFGDSAIKSTKKYKFRNISGKIFELINLMGFEFGVGETLEGDELEKAILIQQRKTRQKVEKTRKKYSGLIDTLNNIVQTSDEAAKSDKEATKVKLQMKMELKINKYQYQIEKMRTNIIAKHKKQSIQNKILDVAFNERVLEIPGNPPLGWDPLISLSHFWKNKQISTLNLFIQISREFYAFPKYNKRKIKANISDSKKKLKKREKEKNKPLKSKNQMELKTINNELKRNLNRLDLNYKKNVKRIKKKYIEGDVNG
ncbi:hypothetical protein DSAG12_00480 [Promethearchaeum syntrophicum]|uniref:DUF362 domain-containing protein n=1 Tax=Promethearchaeum syntrophicum TaxID=2594042 RepID=A0A5B9D777_9ARCH|nr:hypothetical protein [Candidatus Prometheoarchaeum syntrophicum]QEE14667.1 hypothetical protein DSAG12_00480 [Candidatus Prometheoarchaeum syntrophicum]